MSSTPQLKDGPEWLRVPKHRSASFELSAHLPQVTLRQGHLEGSHQVGDDQEHLHVGQLSTGADTGANAVGQEALLSQVNRNN